MSTLGSAANPADNIYVANTGLSVGGNQAYPIVQIVSATSTTNFTTTSGTFSTTNLSASITPKFNTSKVIVCVSGMFQNDNVITGVSYASIFRGTTNLGDATSGFATIGSGAGQQERYFASTYYDSPATTSATTYSVKVRSSAGQTTEFGGASTQSIVLIEVAQ